MPACDETQTYLQNIKVVLSHSRLICLSAGMAGRLLRSLVHARVGEHLTLAAFELTPS